GGGREAELPASSSGAYPHADSRPLARTDRCGRGHAVCGPARLEGIWAHLSAGAIGMRCSPGRRLLEQLRRPSVLAVFERLALWGHDVHRGAPILVYGAPTGRSRREELGGKRDLAFAEWTDAGPGLVRALHALAGIRGSHA